MSEEAAQIIRDALNEQIKQDHYTAELYYAMAAQCASGGFAGFARWFRARAADAQVRAMRLTQFISERGEAAVFKAFHDPPIRFEALPQMLQQGQRREQFAAAWMERLAAFAAKAREAEVQHLMQRCLGEQEAQEQRFTQALQLVGALGDGERVPALLDEEMGRTAEGGVEQPT